MFKSKKKFCFSDGVGRMAQWVQAEAHRILQSVYGHNIITAAVQFRLGGCKGMLAVMPDERLKQLGFEVKNGVFLRQSQKKFDSTDSTLEIVGVSQPNPCYLNRQVIQLLSYLGVEDQSFRDLLDEHIKEMIQGLTDSQKAEARLLVAAPAYLSLKNIFSSGFSVHSDPFFEIAAEVFVPTRSSRSDSQGSNICSRWKSSARTF